MDGGVVERPISLEPVREVVSGADVVAGKDVESAEPSQEGIFGAPTTDAAETHERGDRLLIVERLDRLRVERARLDRAGEGDDAHPLGTAEAEWSEPAGHRRQLRFTR